MKSNCCNAPDELVEPFGCLYSDINRCPKCYEPCEFVEGKKTTNQILKEAMELNHAALEKLQSVLFQIQKSI